ncbi:hypothetical protein AKJ49_01010 [candidate division MSBL1 archaeon SCGC-AAA382A03]|uniref:Uncharacterized protein n=1 Tax=candidate division MSBL1 archaeon SCGC-AAA382A03 TaxID=1698278 RepID=A0A133VFV4_9EURY|nr:hypothetical protein AKJ49_01010 [candidate division MSBL1 archaeon SCGC-AAA382A03]
MQKRRGGIVVLAILVLAIFSFTVPLFSAEEPYEETETYTENEPYETTEIYYVTENYRENVPISYNILDYYGETKWNLKYGLYVESVYVVRNTDNEGGDFKVNFEFNSQKKKVSLKRETKTYYIESGDSHTFSYIYNTKFMEDIGDIVVAWIVEEPLKTVTKTHQVEKERTVTKTREAEKTRMVIKIRKVNASLYEILFKY